MAGDVVRVVILASGAGTLADAIMRGAAAPTPGTRYEVVGLVSDTQCAALDKAAARGVPTAQVPLSAGADRAAWNVALASAVGEYHPDLVVSAGFMRILGEGFLAAFAPRIINTHPALLPAFPGAHAVRDALHYGVQVTGSTVHVVDGGVDTGPIIAQRPVEVLPGDTEEVLHERIKVVERALIVSVLRNDPLAAIAAATRRRAPQ
ncbi:phosphoribosylglycinamide formyltransferase [Corynebacterium sp. 13CS0277]|uniref:phosphoribosylglycinamide formyltransferase n=1 Tax=Corynebacterium sp. 13CS0277 TaxID=2071994 RepID=UPI001E5618BA|nr:phosphoribosylglycinamide formyltransferase [Corynebacterium sp. 13CS0277]